MVLFVIVGALAIASALTVVLLRNPVHSALSLTLNFVCLAVLYLSLGAEFLAAVQVIVYAGAIMVLFLFVVTLLSPGLEEIGDRLSGQRVFAPILALVLFIEVAAMAFSRILPSQPVAQSAPITSGQVTGNAELVGAAIFTTYLFPFEVTSLLLLIAVVGAIVLAKRRI